MNFQFYQEQNPSLDNQQVAIVDIAKSWLGTPFRYQGRTRAGCDCGAPILDIVNTLGICDELEWAEYGCVPDSVKLASLLSDVFVQYPRTERQPGDILLFNFMGRDIHLGVYTFNKTVIHSYRKAGKVVEHPLVGPWEPRLSCAYRYETL